VDAFNRRNQPVVLVNATGRKLVGDLGNAGPQRRSQGAAEALRVHGSPGPVLAEARLFGLRAPVAGLGWVSLRTDSATATFAVDSIWGWWYRMGRTQYPHATELLIATDCGGSNGCRIRSWRDVLEDFADETGISVSVCYFPPGISKWSQIEHRMHSGISMEWSGKSVTSQEVTVSLIGRTVPDDELTVSAAVQAQRQPEGTRVTEKRLAPAPHPGEWNYTVLPKSSSQSRTSSDTTF